MNDTPWFKFYASDWLAGTRGLSPAETGVYVTLLAMIYENGGPIERDDRRLARLCNCATGGFTKVVTALIEQRKLIEIDGGLTNERAEKEMGIRSNRSEKARDTANNRWRKHREKPEENQRGPHATALQTQCDSDAYQKPDTRNQIPDGKKDLPPPPATTAARATDVDVGADEPTERERVLVAMGHDPTGLTATGRLVGSQSDMIEFGRWRTDLGLTVEQILAVVAEVAAAKRDGPAGSFRYFTEAMRRRAGEISRAPLAPAAPTPGAKPSAAERYRRIGARYGDAA